MADMQTSAHAQGKIVQCIGAVVDVEFPRDSMPKIYDALKMEGSLLTLEVQQQLGDRPALERLIGPVKVLLDDYAAGNLKVVYLCYTRFINTMRQEPMVQQLLPLSADDLNVDDGKHGWDYIYEPDAKVVIDELLVRYIEALVYQATSENMASEQSARMVAMKSATDNAGSVIGELKLIYNKTRQAAITKELSEIVAGAAAV